MLTIQNHKQITLRGKDWQFQLHHPQRLAELEATMCEPTFRPSAILINRYVPVMTKLVLRGLSKIDPILPPFTKLLKRIFRIQILTLTHHQKPIGFATLMKWDPHRKILHLTEAKLSEIGYVERVEVIPEYRGSHAFQILHSNIIKDASRMGFKVISAIFSNPKLAKLALKAGFIEKELEDGSHVFLKRLQP